MCIPDTIRRTCKLVGFGPVIYDDMLKGPKDRKMGETLINI